MIVLMKSRTEGSIEGAYRIVEGKVRGCLSDKASTLTSTVTLPPSSKGSSSNLSEYSSYSPNNKYKFLFLYLFSLIPSLEDKSIIA